MSLLPVCNTLIKKGLIIFALVLLNSFYKFDMFQVSLYSKKSKFCNSKIDSRITQTTVRNSHQRCSVKKGVLKNFAKSTGKHLC